MLELKVKRSKEIRVEADVTFNCSKAKELLYQWKVSLQSWNAVI